MKILLASAATMLLLVGINAVAGPAGNVNRCTDCGTVQSIQPYSGDGKASGGGAVIGAVIGGVIGHQFGSGRGNDAATVGGAVAGGIAGNQVEKERNERTLYKVTVAMDAGGTRAVNVRELNGLAAGAKVRVSGENIEKL
jgi:outer membrane lipoprotein SlyB